MLWNMGLGRAGCKTAETEAMKKTGVLTRISAYVVFTVWSDRNSSGWTWVDSTFAVYFNMWIKKERKWRCHPSLLNIVQCEMCREKWFQKIMLIMYHQTSKENNQVIISQIVNYDTV